MKHRCLYIFHLVFYPLIPVILALSTMLEYPVLRWGLVILTVLITGLFVGIDTYCPHCRRFGLYPRAHWKNAGYCVHCGKLVEWKEYAEETED